MFRADDRAARRPCAPAGAHIWGADTVETIQYRVPSISCGHCVATIERVLREIGGVSSVKADVDTKRVEVTFGPPATRDQIEAALVEWGYPPAA